MGAPGSCRVDRAEGIGGAGVDIFFVLSGFVIAFTGPLASPRPTAAEFFWRRLSRVAPLFWLLSLPFLATAFQTGTFNWPQTIATFLFWPAAGAAIVQPFLHQGWTLGFEMLFYSAVAVALAGEKTRRNLAILALVWAALALASTASGWNPLRILGNPVFAEFAAGALLAAAWPRLKTADLRFGAALAACAVVAFAIEALVGVGDVSWAATMENTNALWRVAVFGVPASMLVAGAAIGERALRGRPVAFAAWLGDASYSIYLSQALSIPGLAIAWRALLGETNPWPEGLFLLVAGIAVGAATYALIERPIMRDLRRLRFGLPWTAAAAESS